MLIFDKLLNKNLNLAQHIYIKQAFFLNILALTLHSQLLTRKGVEPIGLHPCGLEGVVL